MSNAIFLTRLGIKNRLNKQKSEVRKFFWTIAFKLMKVGHYAIQTVQNNFSVKLVV